MPRLAFENNMTAGSRLEEHQSYFMPSFIAMPTRLIRWASHHESAGRDEVEAHAQGIGERVESGPTDYQ